MVETGLPDPEYRWQLLGGHPALDLANTVSWRLDPARRVDRVTSYARLADWLRRATGQDAAGTAPSTAEEQDALLAVLGLRDAFTRLLDSHLAGEPPAEADLRAVQHRWQAAVGRAELTSSLPPRWHLAARGPRDVAHLLALLIASFLSEADLSRLRRCDGAGCGWLFLDTTRNHSRRWCDSRDCGNRSRVRRYAERRSRG
jgi:predicted RNA-binding Zn ribbon-like protein